MNKKISEPLAYMATVLQQKELAEAASMLEHRSGWTFSPSQRPKVAAWDTHGNVMNLFVNETYLDECDHVVVVATDDKGREHSFVAQALLPGEMVKIIRAAENQANGSDFFQKVLADIGIIVGWERNDVREHAHLRSALVAWATTFTQRYRDRVWADEGEYIDSIEGYTQGCLNIYLKEDRKGSTT